ncbi:L-amino acid N-acyltransferase MnaT [Frankliniella fusca]|uniref:L-amino acid N-acyltransferase MnaT n=1 Tax=Frankliniella fusca TaxID=407009 RepID=A0AAE1H0P8_9NEOP|nr:L-amino acid N-acyltransferase MnaT [Frankliniella fusca]
MTRRMRGEEEKNIQEETDLQEESGMNKGWKRRGEERQEEAYDHLLGHEVLVVERGHEALPLARQVRGGVADVERAVSRRVRLGGLVAQVQAAAQQAQLLRPLRRDPLYPQQPLAESL